MFPKAVIKQSAHIIQIIKTQNANLSPINQYTSLFPLPQIPDESLIWERDLEYRREVNGRYSIKFKLKCKPVFSWS